MNIRAKIYGGGSAGERVLHCKRPKGAKADDLLSVPVQRRERRARNQRAEDRHRLANEQVRVIHDGQQHDVELINLSGGGAMVVAGFVPKLWDRVTLYLGPDGTVDCVVRWIRDGRVGLEFVEETRLDCPADEVAALLREVIARSFPDASFDLADEPVTAPAARADDPREARRHPLIWSGVLHHDHQSTSVRIRNISATGAMIESATPIRLHAEPLLELAEDIMLPASVEWTVGDQVGIRFERPFDMQLLAQARAAMAAATPSPQWERPTYLDPNGSRSDLDQRWRQLDLTELRKELDGFMKR